jgi:hypothetical protein
VTGHDVDLVDLDLAFEPHRRELGGEPVPELLRHGLHVGLAEVQLLRELPVREVQAHQVAAQDPDPQRLVVARQDGAGQVVEARPAVLAAVALPLTLGVVVPVADHRRAAARGAAHALGPAPLPHQGVALRVVDQGREVHEARRGHGPGPIRRGGFAPSTGCHPVRHAPMPSTPDPEKSQAR